MAYFKKSILYYFLIIDVTLKFLNYFLSDNTSLNCNTISILAGNFIIIITLLFSNYAKNPFTMKIFYSIKFIILRLTFIFAVEKYLLYYFMFEEYEKPEPSK